VKAVELLLIDYSYFSKEFPFGFECFKSNFCSLFLEI
jgi:hypothetical protein